MKVPEILRAIFASSAGVKSVTLVIAKPGALPWIWPSARFVSPSCLKASSRIFSIRAVRLWSEATVKSQAR